MGNAPTQAYVHALLTTVRQPTLMLERLKEHWPDLEQKILRQRQELSSRILADDPIRLSVDLLTPFGYTSEETVHTRAIAYLLDPSKDHGFGNSTLAAVLAKIQRGKRGKGASKLAGLLNQKRTRVVVLPEYRYPIEGARSRSARNDVRIEMRNADSAALIVIENKIDAPEGKGQLQRYEAEARKWCKDNKGPSLLVYLAREGRQAGLNDDQWLGLSYLDFASALRDVWGRSRSVPGHAWLGLYISAITRGVLGIDIDRLKDTTIEAIKAYLGEAPL